MQISGHRCYGLLEPRTAHALVAVLLASAFVLAWWLVMTGPVQQRAGGTTATPPGACPLGPLVPGGIPQPSPD